MKRDHWGGVRVEAPRCVSQWPKKVQVGLGWAVTSRAGRRWLKGIHTIVAGWCGGIRVDDGDGVELSCW